MSRYTQAELDAMKASGKTIEQIRSEMYDTSVTTNPNGQEPKQAQDSPHVYASHAWKKTEGWEKNRKNGYDLHKCVQCGALKYTNRSTLKSQVVLNGNIYIGSFKEPCVFNEKQREEMKKCGLVPPPPQPKKTLDELLLDEGGKP